MNLSREQIIKILNIGLDTSFKGEGLSLHDALKQSNYLQLRPFLTEQDLITELNSNSKYLRQWVQYSEDKRTDGGFALLENYILNLKTRDKEFVDDVMQRTAKYVIFELDFWSSPRFSA